MSTCNAFEQHVLHKIALQPALIAETARTTQASSPALTLTPAQRELLKQAANSNNANSVSSSSSADRYALLQRAMVDLPLMPLGGEQLLYEVLWPAFAQARTAAEKLREVVQHEEGEQQGEGKSEARGAKEGAAEALRQTREELRRAFAHVRQLVQLLERRGSESAAEEEEEEERERGGGTNKRARVEA